MLLISITINCTRTIDDTWEALLIGFPKKIHPSSALINTGLYIIKQTHEPLFYFDFATEQYISKILEKWKRINNKHYVLCPNERLLFNQNENFSVEYLYKFLGDYLKEKNRRFKLYIKNDCIEILFDNEMPHFVKEMSRYENSPTLPSKYKNIDNGLGPYYGTKIENNEIVLKRKSKTKSGFNTIKLINYNKKDSKLLNKKSIEDFNRVYVSDIPSWVKATYNNYGVSLLQTIVLLINHEDNEIRRILRNCIDYDELRRAFMPNQSEFLNIKNILPIGMIGAKKGIPYQKCEVKKKIELKKPLVFYNWKHDVNASISKYFKKFSLNTGIKIKVKYIQINEFIKIILKKPHPYHLTIVALDAVSPDYSAFLSFFLTEGKVIVDYSTPSLDKIYSLIERTDKSILDDNIQEFNRILKDEALTLPLYQEVRTFYFPKRVRNLDINRNFMEYPYIAELKL